MLKLFFTAVIHATAPLCHFTAGRSQNSQEGSKVCNNRWSPKANFHWIYDAGRSQIVQCPERQRKEESACSRPSIKFQAHTQCRLWVGAKSSLLLPTPTPEISAAPRPQALHHLLHHAKPLSSSPRLPEKPQPWKNRPQQPSDSPTAPGSSPSAPPSASFGALRSPPPSGLRPAAPAP